VLRWNDRPVSLVCFDAPARGTVYLFVSKSSEIRGSPAGPDPLFSQVNKMSTASWTAGGDTYLLAVRGDESFLHRQLGR
jgi:hypothetical protein